VDNVQVIAHGPLFDGRAVYESDRFVREAVAAVAVAAEEAVDRNLAGSIRHPSSPPFYQSQINTASRGLDAVVNDGGVIYGPWLEGVGSRNRTTRFKGYFSFRRAKQDIDQRVVPLAAPALARFIAEVNR
jgi:hypothetical protein